MLPRRDGSGLSPDAFALRAFDHGKPLTRMLPGSTPCELRLMLPDSMLGTNGFHDVLIVNLAASPSWRSGHISLADVTALRRCWPKAVFKTMRRHAQEVEHLRRGARKRPDQAFRQNALGFCPVCDVRIESALDVHMLNFHLELAQLWRCPVEWCAVWKGSVRPCLEHLTEKHGGSTFFALKNVAKFFPRGRLLAASGRLLFVQMFRVLRWTRASSMRPDVDWYTGTEYTRIRFRIQRSGEV